MPMRKSALRQKVYDMAIERQQLLTLVYEARDMFERGDFDADKYQRDRHRRFMQQSKAVIDSVFDRESQCR